MISNLSDDVAVVLELQYLALQELLEELGHFPSREEVVARIESYTDQVH